MGGAQGSLLRQRDELLGVLPGSAIALAAVRAKTASSRVSGSPIAPAASTASAAAKTAAWG